MNVGRGCTIHDGFEFWTDKIPFLERLLAHCCRYAEHFYEAVADLPAMRCNKFPIS